MWWDRGVSTRYIRSGACCTESDFVAGSGVLLDSAVSEKRIQNEVSNDLLENFSR